MHATAIRMTAILMILIASPLFSFNAYPAHLITPQGEQTLCHKKILLFQHVTNTTETGVGRFGRTLRGFPTVIPMIFDALRRTHPVDAEDSMVRYSRSADSMVISSRMKLMGLERKA